MYAIGIGIRFTIRDRTPARRVFIVHTQWISRRKKKMKSNFYAEAIGSPIEKAENAFRRTFSYAAVILFNVAQPYIFIRFIYYFFFFRISRFHNFPVRSEIEFTLDVRVENVISRK